MFAAQPFLLPMGSAPHPPVPAPVTTLQEILPAMKLVKYYAWERFFEEHVSRSVLAVCCPSWFGGQHSLPATGCAGPLKLCPTQLAGCAHLHWLPCHTRP